MAGARRAVAAAAMLRPGNVLLACAGTLVGAMLGLGGIPAWSLPLAAALAATAALTASGNVLNDIVDRVLDAQAHPGRALPSGLVGVRAAKVAAFTLAVLGLAAAACTPWPAALLAGANLTVLLAYERFLKHVGLAGNVAVAALVGSTFVFGSLAATGAAPARVILAAALAALANLARELLKDAEDAAADATHRRTFPLQHGKSATAWVAAGCVALAVLLSFPLLHGAGVALAAADAVLLLGAFWGWRDPGRAQRILKLGMAAALAAFALLATQ